MPFSEWSFNANDALIHFYLASRPVIRHELLVLRKKKEGFCL